MGRSPPAGNHTPSHSAPWGWAGHPHTWGTVCGGSHPMHTGANLPGFKQPLPNPFQCPLPPL